MKIFDLALFAATFYQGTIQAAEELGPRLNYLKTVAGQQPDRLNGTTPLCHVKGECEGQLVDFKMCRGVAECLLYCKADGDCNWWTWDDPKQLCLLFETCETKPTGVRCEGCVTGQRSCEFRQYEIPAPCMERTIESTSKVSLGECADACSGVEGCAFYIFEPHEDGSGDCTLFKSCLHMHLEEASEKSVALR